MSEAVVPPIAEIPKRKYRKRKKKGLFPPRAPKIAGTVKPTPVIPPAPAPRPRYGAPKALEEVDRQLATAIAQKPTYHEQLATLFSQTALTQQRLERLNQQIQELVNLQRQLDGEGGSAGGHGAGNQPKSLTLLPVYPTPGPMFGEVPAGVGSIPAEQPAANPGGNVADQAKGGDWK